MAPDAVEVSDCVRKKGMRTWRAFYYVLDQLKSDYLMRNQGFRDEEFRAEGFGPRV